MFLFSLNPCIHFALRKAILRASCQIVLSSSLLRMIFGAIGFFFNSRRQYKRNKKLPDFLKKATRLLEVLAMTWWPIVLYSTMTSKWDHGVGEDSRIWVTQAFPVSRGNMDIKKASRRASSSVSPEQLYREEACVTVKASITINNNSVPAGWRNFVKPSCGVRVSCS